MSSDSDKFNSGLDFMCPYWCGRKWCKWECIEFKKMHDNQENFDKRICKLCLNKWCFWDCQKEKILSVLDFEKYNTIKLIDKKEDFNKEYSSEIKKIKQILIYFLSYIINKWTISWKELIELWQDFKNNWRLLEWYESLLNGVELSFWQEFKNKVKENIKSFSLDKEPKILTLSDINLIIEQKVFTILALLKLLIKYMDNKSWGKLIDDWDYLIKLWNELSALELIKKSLS